MLFATTDAIMGHALMSNVSLRAMAMRVARRVRFGKMNMCAVEANKIEAGDQCYRHEPPHEIAHCVNHFDVFACARHAECVPQEPLLNTNR